MTSLPPLYRDQRKTDLDHLRLLVLFHYIGAGLSGIGLLFVFAHFTFVRLVLAAAKRAPGHPRGPGPEQVFHILIWFYVALALWFILSGIGDLISARCIRARKGRVFSLLVACLNCLHTPVGTILGVFTFVVLLRESVVEVYAAAGGGESQPAAPDPLPTVASGTGVAAEPPPLPPTPPPVPVTEEKGDATGGVIPYKNPHALTAYYLGVFSCFPVLGFFLGIAAIALGVSGLKARARKPVIRGVVHAWIGIVCGSLSVALHLLVFGMLIVTVLTHHH